MAENKHKITTIKLSEDTKGRLNHLKVYQRETYDEIIKKMLEVLNLCRADPERARLKLISIDRQVRKSTRQSSPKNIQVKQPIKSN